MAKYPVLSMMLCLISTFISKADPFDLDSINVYSLENKQLLQILDSILVHEVKCEYYNDELLFFIRIIPDGYYMMGSNNVPAYKNGDLFGCIKHKERIFLLKGEEIKPDSAIFKTTGKKISFIYSVAPQKRHRRRSALMFDDSYSYWWYIYENNRFRFLGLSTFCE
jgi:hypothetical protein